MKKFDVIVVGGGLFGVSIALQLAKKHRTLLIERNSGILQEASFVNQNRVHFGFHYPRSLETAMESLDGYELFKNRFSQFFRPFENYYAIVNQGSLTSPQEFIRFAQKLKAARNVDFDPTPVDQWFFKPDAVSCLLKVQEPVIAMAAVREFLQDEVRSAKNLTVSCDTTAVALEQEKPFVVSTTQGTFQSDYLVNASYGNLSWHNHPNTTKTEVQYVEMVELESQREIPGLTLMDGPGCCGILPLGEARRRYWWYSVAYSVHMRTETQTNIQFRPPLYSNWDRMKLQGEEFFTFMNDLKYVRSHFTARTLLLSQKVDQTAARPSLITALSDGFYQVLSGKLTTCLKVAAEVEAKIVHGDHSEVAQGDGTHIRKQAA